MATVSSYAEAEANAIEFFDVLSHPGSEAHRVLGQFSHWYYFPKHGKLAPSKFIGYQGTTLKSYRGAGSGTKTTNALNEFFVKIPKNSHLFKLLSNLLDSMYFTGTSSGKNISNAINNKGGIYIPNNYSIQEILFDLAVKKSMDDEDDAREERLDAAGDYPEKREVKTSSFNRNPDVVAQVLIRADGECENRECEKPVPFRRISDGTTYLEVHHIIMLSVGGKDRVENAVALCPNCHREAHYGSLSLIHLLPPHNKSA